MKHFIAIFVVLFLFQVSVLASPSMEQKRVMDGDSVSISLLTCAPGTQVYSLYGHTAIRYTDYKNNIDVAINYGLFSFKKSFFVLRFIFGLTDYEMGIMPFNAFYEEYMSECRSVEQQELNLTAAEKKAIVAAINTNYLPENRVYRYNYFYDNCTTRARDILVSHINGKVCYSASDCLYPSFRQLIHSFNEDSPWARFGNDLLLGVKADCKTTFSDYQFLPYNLYKSFSNAKVLDAQGHERALVQRQFEVVGGTAPQSEPGFPLRPQTCAWLLLAVIVLLTGIEWLLKSNFWLLDTFLLLVVGAAGLILLAMLFSEHPTTSTNLQILLLNPLALAFIWSVTSKMMKQMEDRFWLYAVLFIMLFIVGGMFQTYAEGMYIVVLSLLVRCVRRLIPLKYK